MNKTALSAAILAAVSTGAFVEGFEWPADFDDFTKWTANITTDVSADQKIKLTKEEAIGNYPNIIDISSGSVTNKGQLMVQGSAAGNKIRAGGFAVSGNGVGTNEGVIYVDSEIPSNSWSRGYDITKGMFAYDGGKIVNAAAGVIYVKSGAGMADQRDGTAKNASITNDGTIYADSAHSIGINYGAFAESKVTNNGTIVATNGASAVMVSEAWSGASTSGKTFTNTGALSADDASFAVRASGAKDFTLSIQGEGSQIDGRVLLSSTSTIDADGVADDFELVASKLTSLKLSNSSLGFNGNGNTQVASFETDSTSTLAISGARTLTIDELATTDESGVANFTFDTVTENGLVITTNNAKDTRLTYSDESINHLSAEEAAARLAAAADLGQTAEGGDASGTLEWIGTNYGIEMDGQTHQYAAQGSDITKMTNDLAALNLIAWRNEVTTLTDRMSTLRANPSNIGAWARYNGGEYQYDARDIKNQFNTVEVGVDAQVADRWIVGASFSYTKGDGDMDQGTTDTDAYAGALYATWTHEKGSFVDLMMKTGRITSDYDFRNAKGDAFDNGSFAQTGYIVGIETGHRFALPMNTFVEPQIQLTYSRLASVSETTAQRHFELEASDSLLGRVGILGGINCPNDRGSAYVKLSFVRDFRGDIDGTYADISGSGAYRLAQDLDDEWFEYAVGADFRLTDNFVTFVDVSKSAGADIDLDWRANVGAKLFF